MRISAEEILHVAGLARLHMDEEDMDRMAGHLSAILAYVDTLKEVDTEGVAPMSHAVHLVNAMREDRVGEHLGVEAALSGTLERENGHFLVPKIVG
ncbi:Asp-tRNA(Asn)/Glu-tRNA(Gln) amidotransferase subunit GatC [Desulfobotulus sp. H1]|uniref:Aspartyl/glutamyl-tRNA(Asn/Gln) amidotransferase subunit C n=1 Tax=Desulfobotulus pelophilus TaxID=2823377 RepID=A0ABT3N7U2_9BACT|nr:Asp-tRNA(Asn)/Glu-tRNA(Gln) amidotransferase subunit GatC [Desulfobotulus pelophilus]MCW7753107.1 Asp-tRNA(Asn)/Glu-tRNA(Gln) amidotransferase subunit GatC [Desulfobotulus pelophilus]